MGLALVPKAAKVGLKFRPHSQRLADTAADVQEKWNKRSAAMFLAGAVPSASNTIWTSQVQRRDANLQARKLRSDGTLRAKPVSASYAKADDWRDYVSPGAQSGYDHLRSGARRDKTKGLAGAGAGLVAGGIVGESGWHLARNLRPGPRIAASGLTTAAGAGIGLAGLAYNRKKQEKAKRWDAKAQHIKNVGQSRMTAAQSAMDPAVAKALLKPTGMVMGAAMRRSSVVRTPSGKLVARRGAVARTSRPGSGVA